MPYMSSLAFNGLMNNLFYFQEFYNRHLPWPGTVHGQFPAEEGSVQGIATVPNVQMAWKSTTGYDVKF